MKRLIKALVAGSLAALALQGAALASDYYKGKTVTYIVATDPGGGYDTYGRLIAKYMQKYLGADRVLVRNVPGAGHIVGANTLYSSPPDGLTIGTFNTGLIYAQLLGFEGVQFDLRKFEWIGKAASDPRAMVVSEQSGFQTVDDMRKADRIVFAGAGIGSSSYVDTKMVATALDLPLDIVTGFNGNEGEMAMMRGEVAGQMGSLSSLEPYVKNNGGKVIMALGAAPDSGIPDGLSLAKTEDGKALMSLVAATSVLGRLTAAPPNTDPDRVADLRDAYMKALNDPDLQKEADKLGIPIDPAGGEQVAKMIGDALNQSPKSVEIIAAATEVEVPTITVTSKLLTVDDGGKQISFNSGDAVVESKVSGSRTAVKIDGSDANRKELVAGMQCKIEYNPEADGNEPTSLDCASK